MFLKQVEGAATPPWPGARAENGWRASVTFLDDVPVLAAEGMARFEVVRRRWRFGRVRMRVVEACPGIPARMRRGDVLALATPDGRFAWRYDPDGNLGRGARIALRAARVGTAVAVIGVLGVLGTEMSLYAATLYYGGPGNPEANKVSALVRENASTVYPRKSERPSDYLKALLEARRAKGDVAAASAAWIKDHPLPQTASETTR